MAPATGVRTYLCLCLNFVFCMLQFLPQTYTKSVLTVPHDAEPGYFISQIACTRPEVRIRTFGENSKEFYDKFHITNTGVLVVKSTLSLSSDIDKTYYFSAYQNRRCFDRVKSHDNFIIHVRNSRKVVHFSKRLYSFRLLKSQSGVTVVQNGELIRYNHDNHIPNDRVKFFLKGTSAKYFSVVKVSPKSLRIEASSSFEISTSRILHFRLFAEYNNAILGVVDINIIALPQENIDQPLSVQSHQPNHVQSQARVHSARPSVLVVNFDQTPNGGRLESQTALRRVRRQTGIPTSTLSFDVNETATGRLFTVDPGVPPGTVYAFNLTEATPQNIFSVDSDGNVSLRPGERLQYDFDGTRTYTISLEVISGSEVLRRVIVTLNVLNVNDENPYFTTRPTPYLATIPEQAEARLKVFQLQATDPDGGSIVYFIPGINENFDINRTSGWIETKRPITVGTDYNVSVYAVDSTAATDQRTPTVTVEIRRGTRKPQFLSESYLADVEEVNLEDQIFETTDNNGNKVKIEAINFQERLGGTIQYTVYENVNTKSTRFAVEDGNLKTLQPLDYETDPHSFTLTVMALDSYTGLSSIAQLVVNVVDKNEYAPLFSKSTYTANVRETLPKGSIVTTVSASDKDANTNISYTVTNPLFAVPTSGNGQTGNVIVNGELDYDKTPRNRYEFDIIATDNGINPYPRNATARIIVNLINENDQDPKFDDNLVTSLVNNTAGGTTIFTVRATDEDGDGITYSFQGGTNIYQLFEIERDTGKIILRPNTRIPEGTDRYELPVVATDDGSCCASAQPRSSSATVVINIIDAVNLKPNFVNCASYASTVLEDQEPGAVVTKVSATDQNRGENGVVEYYIIEDQKNTAALFSINNMTGELVTSARLDRETQSSRNLFITVRAVDRGNPPLDDYCTFAITVGDVNDNDPIFRSNQYTGQILKAASVGTVVLTVQADDSDLGMNAAIQYSITSNPGDYFRMDKDTGEISVNRSLNTASNNVVLSVEAKDQGSQPRSSTSTVIITVSTDPNVQPPRWTEINPLFQVAENADLNYIVGTLTAENRIADISDPGLDFNIVGLNNRLSQVDPSGNFIIAKVSGAESVNIKINKILDYETKQEYTITIRASNRAGGNGIFSDNVVRIKVQDVNDVNPEFQNINPDSGKIDIYVKENSPAGTVVSGIVATDGDLTAPFNETKYSLLNTNGRFDIDRVTGVITTRRVFDREATSDDSSKYYYVSAIAVDGANSSKPGTDGPNTGSVGVQIIIQDENDNSPYFEQSLYTASVQEDSFIGSSIVTVAAKDDDDPKFTTFTYTLEGSSLFDVNRRTGTIRVAGNLDYETPPNTYTLTLTVDDGKYSNRTNVQITIIDTNDNSPVFDNDTYIIRTITENEDYTNRPPILKVHATDPDTERDSGMEYEIAQGDSVITSLFSVNRTTGDLSLRGSLDRDRPNGREVYQFNVLAIDEPGSSTRLTGYATVQVFPIDVNDNDPFFLTSSLTASVREMSAIGVSVMTVKAEDYDAGQNAELTYNIVDGSQTPREAFRMNSDGSVFTTVNNLDRETNPTYYFEVVASDNGVPKRSTTATATVNIKDINDNSPRFSQRVYEASIPETHTGRIMTLTATDLDIDDQLRFELTGEATTFFFMRQEETKIGSLDRTGVLEVYTKPDYEKAEQRNFNFSVIVTDTIYSDTAFVVIEVLDVNDEIPNITPAQIEVERDENVPVNTTLATFTAVDADVDPNNGAFDFFISGKPLDEMPNFYFSIDANGVVRVKNPLDYEKISTHIVKILAIDRGLPPQTGTATLTVRLNNINDNAPNLREDTVSFKENTPPAIQDKVYIYAEDPDGPPFAGPFTIGEGSCAPGNNACDNFNVVFSPSQDRAEIVPLSQFDREEKLFYELPIVMSDMRTATGADAAKRLTGTSTLTIQISDENDNPSSDGTQNIHVYNYKGMFANIFIGSAHYEDRDDDRADKQFSLIGSSNYFNVSQAGGNIMMLAHVPSGRHTLAIRVTETNSRAPDFRKSVRSIVTIYIEDLPEEAPYKSGSVRLTGITSAEFVKNSLESFRSLLETKLKGEENEKNPTSKAQIISVTDTEVDGVKYCDVRYAALGSPYYPASKVDGIVEKDKDQFANTLGNGASIAMVSIDMCLREICEGGGCHNKLIVKDEPNLVDANGSSFVGVATEVMAECGCKAATNVTECSANYCLNGGTCSKDLWGNLHCNCPADFNGPRCQQTSLGFDGTGYALFETLRQCENSVTSIEFITLNANALIMYNGPVRALQALDPEDFFVLQMRAGYPELTINHGTGSLTLSVNGRDAQNNLKMAELNDGKWHQIDIRRQGKVVTLTVDNCLSADNVEGAVQDRSPCEATGATKGENKYLNINSQLQLGGRYAFPRYPSNILSAKFRGCMRNFRHNGELYDLYTKNFYDGIKDGCPEEDTVCGKNSVNARKCENGICEMTEFPNPPSNPGASVCICNPGYRGSLCQDATTVRDFRTDSFMDWQLTNDFINSLSTRKLDIQLQYRSRDRDGMIFHVQAQEGTEFMRLEIIDNILQALYNFGDENRFLQLSEISASDGAWHTVYIKRRGQSLVLQLDGGEGDRYAEMNSNSLYQEMAIKGDQIYAGAQVSYEHTAIIDSNNKRDFSSSCMNDIRLNQEWFPMTLSENSQSTKVRLQRDVNTNPGCVREDCTLNIIAQCAAQNKTCLSLWGAYECVCAKHHEPSGQSCVQKNYCALLSPCHHLSTCLNNAKTEHGYVCICPPEMEGHICNIARQTPVPPDERDDGWIVPVVIVLCLLILIIIIVVGIIFGRRLCSPASSDARGFVDLEKEDYDIRENIVNYDEEGAGEFDNDAFDISRLRKPADLMTRMDRPDLMATNERPLKSGAPPGGQVGDFIEDRLQDADDDPSAPPHDTTRNFDYEGGGSDAGSLSSLNTTTSDGDQDYDYLNNWGPKFAKLADMYNNYEDSE